MTLKSAKTGKFTKDTDPSTTIKQQATGYVVDHRVNGFVSIIAGSIQWTADRKLATQFARKVDATDVAEGWLPVGSYDIKKVRS